MDVYGIAASGLQAAQAQLNVTANNIANSNTPGFNAQRVDLVPAPQGDGVDIQGVSSTQQPFAPATEMVNLDRARVMYDANGMVVKVADQMYGSLLNVLDNQNQDSGWDKD